MNVALMSHPESQKRHSLFKMEKEIQVKLGETLQLQQFRTTDFCANGSVK